MAEIHKPYKVGNYWTNLIDSPTGEVVTYEETAQWWDGSPMDDAKVDGNIYRKLPADEGSGYVKRVYANFGQLFLEKDTVSQVRALTTGEIILLRMGRYRGVKLNGYHQKGDTPAPIEYLLSTTSEEDDGGSVFEVGDIKLEHKFVGEVDVRYFGAIGDLEGNLSRINSVIVFANNKNINNVTISSRTKITLPDTYDAIGINMLSNISLNIKSELYITENNYPRYRIINIDNVTNCSVIGFDIGTIKGDVQNHTGTTGEWGQGIYIYDNCRNITIKGLIIKECWGDGIYIGGFQSDSNYSEDINVSNCYLDSNRRQGISVVKGNNITISSNTIVSTGKIRGTFPMDGIDIEPNANNKVSAVKITNNFFEDNLGYDFQIYGNSEGGRIDDVIFNGNTIVAKSEKGDASINSLISISGRRLDNSVYTKSISLNNNTIRSRLSDIEQLIYIFGSASDINVVGNSIDTENNITSIKMDTVRDINIHNNTVNKGFHFVNCITQCYNINLGNNYVASINHSLFTASSSGYLFIRGNVVREQTLSSVRLIGVSNANNVYVENNFAENLQRGFFMNSSSANDVEVKNNYIKNFNISGTANEAGIYITGAGNKNLVISSNTIIQDINNTSIGIRSSLAITSSFIKDNILIGSFSTRISNESGAGVLVQDKNIIVDATAGVAGIVRRSAAVLNATAALPPVNSNSTAGTIQDLVSDYNILSGNYNSLRALVNEMRARLNEKLLADRNSGQQTE